MDKIKKLIESLNLSPVYAMSLGSKELFHSNFWHWLMVQDKSFCKIFFDIDTELITQISREKKNRDITIETAKGSYVIENKLKSIPSKEQLLRYQTDLKYSFIAGVLTGIETPDFNLKGWSFISYKTIALQIWDTAVSSESENIKSNIEIIRQYCENLQAIDQLLNLMLNRNPGTLDYNCYNLKEIKLDDIYKKLSAQRFIKFFRERYSKELKQLCDFELITSSYYANGKAGIDVRFQQYKYDKNNKKYLSAGIGVQIEHYQFRVVAEKRPDKSRGETRESLQQVYDTFCKADWFDDTFDVKTNRQIFGRKTSMYPIKQNKCNSYQTEDYTFVYQYFDLPENISYTQLSQTVMEYMLKAVSIASKDI